MARWGEGDPRWLVEDRPDATNVNNWHWTEKNASNWSKNKLNELLGGVKIENDVGTCEVTEMSKCEGEAAVNNRKGKLIFIYEWQIELKWKGVLKNSDDILTGIFEVANLSEEHEIKDVDVTVIADKTTPEVFDLLMGLLRSKGIEIIKQHLSTYVKCLKEEFSKGVILPTKGTDVAPSTKKKIGRINEMGDCKPILKELATKSTETAEMTLSENFKCQADEFYKVLTMPELVQAFTQGPCTVDGVKGGKFILYGGNVYGHFTELIPNELIKMKWRFKTWPDSLFSDVTIKITEGIDSTKVHIHQTGIPRSELDNTRDGWKRYYWESIKRTFGFGAILF